MQVLRPPAAAAVLLLGISSLSGPAASAQDAAAAPAGSDQVVTLSQFDVSGQAVRGYVANEANTGTRMATKIADLPFSVNVVTHDFIEDFSLFQLNDQLSFISGFSPSDGSDTSPTQYQLRGFQSTTTLVDGFQRFGLVDKINIDRIEVIKGTSADIYGAIVPGGIVNIITKQPTTTPTQELEISHGGFAPGGLWAGSANNEQLTHVDLSSSGPLGDSGKLFYRLDLAYEYLPYGSQFSQDQQTYGDIQLLYKPSEQTTLRLTVEADSLYSHPQGAQPTLAIFAFPPYQPAKMVNLQVGLATPNYPFPIGLTAGENLKGPIEYRRRRQQDATVTFEHRFSDIWSVRASANGFADRGRSLNTNISWFGLGNSKALAEPTLPVAQIQPQWFITPEHGGGYQIDSLMKLEGHGLVNKLLITNDFYQVNTTDWQYNVTGSSYYNPRSPAIALPDQPYSIFNLPTDANDPAAFNLPSQNTWTKFQDYGLFVSDSLSLLRDRLFATASVRYDFVWNEARNYLFTDPVTGANERQDTSYGEHAYSHAFGLLGKVTDQVSLFVNDSTAFNPQPQLDQNGNPLPNNNSTGVEFGVKSNFFGGKLNLTIDHFETNEFNLSESTKDANGNKIVVLTGQETAKGFEADMNWQPTRALQFFGGYGYTEARVVNAYGLPLLIGRPTAQAPRNNLGVGARYSVLSGVFKGLFFTANEKYYSKSLVRFVAPTPSIASAKTPLVNIPYVNGFLPFPALPAYATVTSGSAQFDNGSSTLFNAPAAIMGLGVGYTFKSGRYAHTIGVNASNVLNRYYTFGQGAPGDPCEIVARYKISF